MLLVVTSFSGPAWGMATLFDDHFDDGTLATNSLGTGGGFISTDNGFTPIGSSSESDSQAKILEGGTSNRHGIESINGFDLSDDALAHVVTWEIASWGASGNSGERRIALSLKSYSDSQAPPSDTSVLSISVDEKSNHVSFTFSHRTDGVATNHSATTFDLDGNFSGDSDGFTLTLTLDASGFRMNTIGLNNSSQVNLNGTWASMSAGGTDFNTVLGADGPMFVAASIQNQNFTGAKLDVNRITLSQEEPVFLGSILEWNSIDANSNQSLYLERNWIDPVTGEVPVSANTLVQNAEINRPLVIRAGDVGLVGGAPGDLLMGLGDLTLSNSTLNMQESASIDLGSGSQDVIMDDAEITAEALTNAKVVMDGYSALFLKGADPLAGTTVDLLSSDCFVHLLDVIPTQMLSAQLSKFTVNGVAANAGGNVIVSPYYTGSVIRPVIANNNFMRGFDGADLTGTSWNFGTGFKGRLGAGLIGYKEPGIYTVDGWGADVWSTADQCRFTYREMTGDVEIIAKMAWVQDTNLWAKGGVMIRSDLTAGSPNAFMCQRPDKAVTFQSRVTAGGNSTSAGALGASNTVKYVRLVRSGDEFTGYYSTNANGPWTQAGSTTTIDMPDTILVGIAATSHDGLNRGTSSFHEVRTEPASPRSEIGIFDHSVDIESAWSLEDRISSFLLKKGYMVTVSTEGGGQGTSQVYVATEGDLMVNLPAALDNKIRNMRILPWRWTAKKGIGAANPSNFSSVNLFWHYEWEPTGASTTDREFVPMIKGRGQDSNEFRWMEVRARGGQTHFLCFNEPESANQGDLTVDEAIALYPKALQLGLRIGSPARTDGSNGDNWLSDFMEKADAKGYRVDFVCVHNYNRTNASGLKSWLQTEYNKYGRPLWLTEFQRETNGSPSAAEHEAYLAEVIPMLEELEFVERYAYYDFNTSNGTNQASLTGASGANAKGVIYRDIDSQPAYVNLQPDWAISTLDLPSGGILQVGSGGEINASTSIDSSKINKVEFFVNGVLVGSDANSPYQLSTDSLSEGLQSVHSVVTTNFGERLTSQTSQVFVTNFSLLELLPGIAGEVSWSAVPGETYHFESSDDFSTWTEIEQRVATGFQETASDPAWGTGVKKFYRVRW